MQKEDEHNIYYNIVQQNKTGRSQRAEFTENRVQPILENPSKYEMAVVRFSVPAYEIPIMFFKDGSDASNGERYSVSLTYGATTITTVLLHVPNEIPKTLYGRPAVWAYQEMVDSINVGYETTFNLIKIAEPLAPQTEAPFLTFDPVSNLFTLYAEQSYDITSPTTMGIFMNKTLFKLFPSFEITFDSTLGPERSHQLLIKDNKLNSTTYNGNPYYTMQQESSSLSQWYDFVSLQFETDAIPVSPEYDPNQNNVISRVLTDFEPIVDEPSRETIQYFPQGPLRYYDLVSNYPMKRIDLRITWLDKNRVSYPLFLANDDTFTCKLLFRLKTTRLLKQVIEEEKDEIL